MTLSGEDIDHRQALVQRLLDWSCGGERGVSEDDPHYREVTEGRDVGAMRARYSSCGDLAHWLLFRLGVRAPWVNRTEHRGWKVGANVSMLATTASIQLRRTPVPGVRFEPGDVLIVWNDQQGRDAHVMVVYEHRPDLGRFIVGEYGQPGGHVRKRLLTARDGILWVGTRKVQRWLPLALVLEYSETADVTLPDGLTPTEPAPPLEETEP
jgi:hypothetical protein